VAVNITKGYEIAPSLQRNSANEYGQLVTNKYRKSGNDNG